MKNEWAIVIEHIKSVLNIRVSTLVDTLGVPRQVVYKWMAGTAHPDTESTTRLLQLNSIANAILEHGIAHAGWLVKMKAFDGQSVIDLVKSGKFQPENVNTLVGEARIMEDSYRKSRLPESKAKATDDWRSYISIPGSIEQR